jgi:DNA-binding MarR family transcriptional regulator
VGRLPLATLLSHALVAFTIELDDEFERRMPHRTSAKRASSRGDPWLVSLAMWSTCMRFVPDAGVTVRELEQRARTTTNLNGMQRWGYVVIGPDGLVRATAAGRRAQELWRALPAVIEMRWEGRVGKEWIDQLRSSLRGVAGQLDAGLPDSLPILGYGLRNKLPPGAKDAPPVAGLSLADLLSRVLLGFALEYERESKVSLAIGANVLRVLGEPGRRVRDLPRLSGVSREAISMALGFLEKRQLAVVEPDPAGGRGRVVRLTPSGRDARDADRRLLGVVEQRWDARFGAGEMGSLRAALERVAAAPRAEPYADGWRASVRAPDTLPHFPMVLHRGGFPDGS